MARISYSERFASSDPPEHVRTRLLQAFTALGARVVNASDVYIEARTGSQLSMRIKGGLIAKTKEFPMRTSLTLSENSAGGTDVDVTCVDEFGVGFKIGVKRKYETAFREMVSYLRNAVS